MDGINFDLRNSSKNYLFVPLRLVDSPAGSNFYAYDLDIATVESFSDRCLARHSLKTLTSQGLIKDEELEKAVFFSRFEP